MVNKQTQKQTNEENVQQSKTFSTFYLKKFHPFKEKEEEFENY